MPPMMTTQSAGQPAAASRGGGMGRQARRGSGRTRGRSGDQDDGRIDGQGRQVGCQGNEVTKVEVKEMVGIKTIMLSMTTSEILSSCSSAKSSTVANFSVVGTLILTVGIYSSSGNDHT
nr:hypothetical protein [Tanacetum cinerariifolium]